MKSVASPPHRLHFSLLPHGAYFRASLIFVPFVYFVVGVDHPPFVMNPGQP